MDWTALALSLRLAFWTSAILLPAAIVAARLLTWRAFPGKGLVEALIALPLVLPPTVLGYYLLVLFGAASPLGRLYEGLVGRPLVFSFAGLLVASVLFNLPFAVQPLQRAYEGIPRHVREAAWVSGLSSFAAFRRIELPLTWTGLASAFALTFAHTMGEFGVVLMVGGNIPGETRTLAVSIYDRVQAFDLQGAGFMSALLLALSFVTIGVVFVLARRGAGPRA